MNKIGAHTYGQFDDDTKPNDIYGFKTNPEVEKLEEYDTVSILRQVENSKKLSVS